MLILSCATALAHLMHLIRGNIWTSCHAQQSSLLLAGFVIYIFGNRAGGSSSRPFLF